MRFGQRAGGYTRIIRIGHRLGDAGETAYLELVKTVEQKEQEREARATFPTASGPELDAVQKKVDQRRCWMFSGPGVQVVAKVPVAGPVPPPSMVVTPLASRTGCSDGVSLERKRPV